ncbi:MAG: hypothetical protein H6661_09750 [Ardenticatenaceae bacterium]|nr:hypothetical protein [Ardenticatenaceae bacterium]
MNGRDSLSKTAPDADQTFAPLATHLSPNGRLRRTWPLAGGISADMTAVEMEDGNGRAQKFVVRQYGPAHQQQNPHIAAHEFQLLRRLQDAGIAAPPPHSCRSAGLLGKPCLVMATSRGSLDFAPADGCPGHAPVRPPSGPNTQPHRREAGWPLLRRGLGVACPELARFRKAIVP